jgi:Integrase core domain
MRPILGKGFFSSLLGLERSEAAFRENGVRPEVLRHEYELYLAVENIDHTRTKVKSPQTNGICERFHKTLLDEFYRVAFRKELHDTPDTLQTDLDEWMVAYNDQRTHQAR